MSNMAIFKQQTEVSARVASRELSPLAQAVAPKTSGRRIAAKNGKFHRIINGEKAGSMDGPLNIIVVNALPEVSRTFYAKTYDPDAEATLPNCWSNLGDVPDPRASNKQSATCATCPKNIDGSGKDGKGRACRFNRKIAVLLDGDKSGDLYQMNIPALSLFGKGADNKYPFQSYLTHLTANGVSVDRVVTEVTLDEDADVSVMRFTPFRHINDEELDLVDAAQNNPMSKSMIQITVAETDGVTKKPEGSDNGFSDEPAKEEVVKEPEAKTVEGEVVEEEKPEEPKKRSSPKASKPKEVAPESSDLDKVINQWAD